MRHLFKRLPIGPASAGHRKKSIACIDSRRRELYGVSDEDLKAVARDVDTLPEAFAVTAVLSERLLGFKMFDVQLHCALALADGKIAEMQTGEGKTLSAVPTVVWLARAGKGVHANPGERLSRARDLKVDEAYLCVLWSFRGLHPAGHGPSPEAGSLCLRYHLCDCQ